jgi:hypothetical protein
VSPSTTLGFADFSSPRGRRGRIRAFLAAIVVCALFAGCTAVVNATRATESPPHGSATVRRERFRAGPGTTGSTSTSTTEPPPTTAPPTTAAPSPAPPPGGRGIAGSLQRGLLFGLGTESSDARDDRLVREAPVGMLSTWYNGPHDLDWITDGFRKKIVPEVYATGKAHHLIVWTDIPEGPLNTAYGPACGRAYPVSDRFVGDMERLATTFAGPAEGPPLYVTLFTEFQTFPCHDNEWAPDAETTNYYKALKDNYRKALAVFHRVAPNSRVSLGWGGWQLRWDVPDTDGGRSLLPHFDDVMRLSDFQSFQAMSTDTNVADVRAMTKALGKYGPVMLAHYKPNGGVPATWAADLRAMLTDAYLDELMGAGLFAFCFMDHREMAEDEAMYQLIKATIHRRGVMS